MCQKKLIWIICNKRTKEILFQPLGRPDVANLLPETRRGLLALRGAWHLNSALFPPGAPRGGDPAGEGLGGGFLQPVGEGFIFVEPVACCFYPVTALARQNSGWERWLVADDGREEGDTCSPNEWARQVLLVVVRSGKSVITPPTGWFVDGEYWNEMVLQN